MTKNIDFQVNHNINPNYYLELIRSIRKLLGFSIAKKIIINSEMLIEL